MYSLLAQYILQRVPTDEADLSAICAYFQPQQVKRKAFLLREGEVCRHYYFINKGCIRLFNINSAGEEGTRYFAFEGSFGTALPSLIDQKPAFEYLQAVEDSDLLVIRRDDFYYLVENTPQFGAIYRQILEAAFITAQKRIYGFQGSEAIDKLRSLLAYQPTILSRISNKMAASYLGITPATLSRIKSKI